MSKLILIFLLILTKSLWAQNAIEKNPMFGVTSKYDEAYLEKYGLVKIGSIPWTKILKNCEPQMGIISGNPNPLVKQRCCYQTLEQLEIEQVPLVTSGGANAVVALPKIEKFVNNSNSMIHFATAQFQKVKFINTTQNRLLMCTHVVYQNKNGLSLQDPFKIFFAMKEYADNHPEWSLQYFYIDNLSKTPCELISENGDINHDGRISNADITKLNKDYISLGRYEKKFDFNNDGKLDSGDANLIQDYLLKKLECYQ